jgi:polar amino acid transport system substrate-binding protein
MRDDVRGSSSRSPALASNRSPQVTGLILGCSLILFAVVVLSLTRGGAQEPLEPILLATGEWSPYSGESLASRGVASAIVSAIFRQMGYEPEFRFMPWARAEQAALDNDANRGVRATFPYASTPERESAFYFSRPVFSIELSVFYNAERNPAGSQIATAADLLKFEVVPISGYRYPAEAEKAVARLPAVDSNLSAFKLLIASSDPLVVVEATRVGEELLGGVLALEAGRIRTAPLRFTSPIHLIASRRNPNNSSLIRRFDETLADVQRANGLDQIQAEVLDAIDEQRMVRLQPLQPLTSLEALLEPQGTMRVMLPQGTRAVVERWSSNFLAATPVGPTTTELVRVRLLNGPHRGRSVFVDERAIVLP